MVSFNMNYNLTEKHILLMLGSEPQSSQVQILIYLLSRLMKTITLCQIHMNKS